jgi:pyrroloquinoline quinone biosynthesis protein E
MHCSSESSRQISQDLPLNTIKKVITDFAKLGGQTLEISGGEPLCRRDLPDIVEHANGLNLEVCLFSCGIFEQSHLQTDDDGLREKVAELRRLGIAKVLVTLHASNEKDHDEISRRNGSFRRTSLFAREVVRAGIYVGVHFVPVGPNFDNMDDLVTYCGDLGVDQVALLRFVPQGRGKEHADILTLNEEETLHLADLLYELQNKKSSLVRVGSHLDFSFVFDEKHQPQRCKAGISKCLVTSQGEVFPCAAFKGLKKFVAGNVNRDTLADLWINSRVFRELRQFDYKKLKGPCESCRHLKKCRGQCPAQRFYKWQDLYMGPDPYCPKPAFDRSQS